MAPRIDQLRKVIQLVEGMTSETVGSLITQLESQSSSNARPLTGGQRQKIQYLKSQLANNPQPKDYGIEKGIDELTYSEANTFIKMLDEAVGVKEIYKNS